MAAPTLNFENGAWAFSRTSSAACNNASGIGNPWEQRFQETYQRAANAQTRFEHLLVIDLLRRDAGGHIRHARNRQALHAKVVRNNHLWHRRHADQIGAD